MTALSGLGSIVSMRVKRLDVNELKAVAGVMAQQEAGYAQQAGIAQTSTAQTAPQQTAPQTAEQYADANYNPARYTQSGIQVQTQADTQAQSQTQAQASTGGAAVDVPSSSIAPRSQHDFWTKHIAQFRGKYLPDGPSMRPNCGPASVTMALRMIGLDVPGFSGQNSEAVLDKARVIGTGKNDTSVGTTDTELERVVEASGGRWSESNNLGEILGWVKQGIPVVLSGNPTYGWNSRYRSDQVYPFNGGHWVTVSGYDNSTGYYIVNDPLSQIGPIYVSESELASYNRAHGGLGIAVFR